MRKKLTAAILVIFILTLVPTLAVSAEKPLRGTMDLQFNLGWPGPQDHIPDWIGTITINGETYDMAFYCTGSGKPFVTTPDDLRGVIHFFEETWVIGHIDYEFDENGVLIEYNPIDILLWGYDTGSTNTVNSNYHMTGNVEEAFGVFEGLAGRNVYMSGEIIWYPFGAPHFAPGIFRIN